MRAWTGRGDGDAIRGSTGRGPIFDLRDQIVSAKEAEGLRPRPGAEKTTASWVREARRCPRAPAGTLKLLIPLCFFKVKRGKGVFSNSPPPTEWEKGTYPFGQ